MSGGSVMAAAVRTADAALGALLCYIEPVSLDGSVRLALIAAQQDGSSRCLDLFQEQTYL